MWPFDFMYPRYGVKRLFVAACVLLTATTFSQSANACPDWRQTGNMLNYSSDALWTPRSFSVLAGGPHDLDICAAPGNGHVAGRPDFTLNFSGNSARRDLEFRVQGSCDTVLLIHDATAQWHFNDDADGTLNPRLRLPQATEGSYDIWVGTYGPGNCSATLYIETFPASGAAPAPAGAGCPDWTLSGVQLNYGAEALWTPRSFNVVAGGGANLSTCPMPGTGHVATAPDFTLNFNENNAGRELEFRVQAECDTVLLVNDATAQWHFNDDADGTVNPRLRLSPAPAGAYDIWVGTWGSGTCAATLTLETFGGGASSPVVGEVLDDPGSLTSFRNRMGEAISFRVRGSSAGGVWGTGIYTDDSRLATAAVHAGVLRPGQEGVVRVLIMPGQAEYPASNSNGVNSMRWGSWSGSFRFVD